MTEEQMTLAIIRDTIAQAPEEERAIVNEAALEIRAVLQKHGAWGSIALALIGAELAASA